MNARIADEKDEDEKKRGNVDILEEEVEGYGEEDDSCSVPTGKWGGVDLFKKVSVFFGFGAGFEVDETDYGNDGSTDYKSG